MALARNLSIFLVVFTVYESAINCDDYGEASNICKSCINGNEFDPISGLCKCGIGYYMNENKACTQCHFSCDKCNGPDQNQCTKCGPLSVFVPNALNESTGICKCTIGSYENFDRFNIMDTPFGPRIKDHCLPCHENCAECLGPQEDQCITCTSYRKKWNSYEKKCQCESGYYEDAKGACRTCHQSCNSCSGPFASQCISCRYGVQLFSLEIYNGLKIGSCRCGENLFSPGSGVCAPCHPNCKECYGPGENECLVCKNSDLMVLSDRSCGCPNGSYYNKVNSKCDKCQENCNICEGSNICLKCKLEFVLANGQCVCPDNTVLSKTTGLCQGCGELCKKCDDKGICSECVQGAIYNTLTNTCACSQQEPYYISSLKICSENCLEGYYYDEFARECFKKSCTIENCHTCSNEKCLLCLENFYLKNNICMSYCPEGFFWNAKNQQCTQCSNKCKTCIRNADNCLSCKEKYIYSPFDHICKNPLNCSEGTFYNDNNNTCVNCDDTCRSCSGKSKDECLSCKNDRIYQNGTCLECQSVQGYMLNISKNVCEPICGDGYRVGNEECDDGNTIDMDGCSSTCKVEPGYECQKQIMDTTKTIDVCYAQPRVTVKSINDDPYHIIIQYSHEMIETNMCYLDIFSTELKFNEYDSHSIRLSNTQCLIQIFYYKNLMNTSVYIMPRDENRIMDINFIKVDNNDFQTSILFNNFIYRQDYKQYIDIVINVFISILYWLIIVSVCLTLPLIYLKSSYLFWNLIDFIQRISLIGFIDFNVMPYYVVKFFNQAKISLGIIPEPITLLENNNDDNNNNWLTKNEFFRSSWVLFSIILITEIVNKLYDFLSIKMHKSLADTIKFKWNNRFRIMGIITIPLYLYIFIYLFRSKNDFNILIYIIILVSISIHQYIMYISYNDLVHHLEINNNDQQLQNIDKKEAIDLVNIDENTDDKENSGLLSANNRMILIKYIELLNGLKINDKNSRKCKIILSYIRILTCLLIIKGNIIKDLDMQLILLCTIEISHIIYYYLTQIFIDTTLSKLLYLEHITIIIILLCMMHIHNQTIYTLYTSITWIMLVIILIMILTILLFNMNRLYMIIQRYIALNKQKKIDFENIDQDIQNPISKQDIEKSSSNNPEIKILKGENDTNDQNKTNKYEQLKNEKDEIGNTK